MLARSYCARLKSCFDYQNDSLPAFIIHSMQNEGHRFENFEILSAHHIPPLRTFGAPITTKMIIFEGFVLTISTILFWVCASHFTVLSFYRLNNLALSAFCMIGPSFVIRSRT